MADYVVRLTGQDNLSGTIKNVKSAVNDLGSSASTSLDKFTQKFQRIEQSTAPLKKQLRDLKAIMAEMQFKGLSNTDEFTKIAQYAGQVKNAMDDAATATKRFSDDIFALRAAADAVTVVTGAFTAVTGAMNLFGVENEKVKNAILKVQSAMAILNGVQSIANALNKDSALMQALKATKMKISTAVANANTNAIKANTVAENLSANTTKKDTAAKAANTIAENVNGAATKRGTIIQQAWNIAKAVAKALLGDFTGLAIVAAGAIATYALATANSTDEIEEQNDALKDDTKSIDENAEAAKHNKEIQEEWANSVAQSAGSQISTYRMLQKKWNECNGDVKLQQKFMHDYKSEIDSLKLGIHSLVDAENAFVSNTNNVVNAIIARAKAEAYQDTYKKLETEKIQLMMENENDIPTAKWHVATAGGKYQIDATEANKMGFGQGDYSYHNIHTGVYTVTAQGAAKATAYWRKQAEDKARQDHAERYNKRVAQINQRTKQQTQVVDLMEKSLDESDRLLKDAGLSGGSYNQATGGGAKGTYGRYGKGGSGGSRHGGSSKGGSGNGGSRQPTEQDKLDAADEKIREMRQNLEEGLISPQEIDNYIQTLAKLEVDRDTLAKKIGKPLLDSLDWKKQELSRLQSELTKGYTSEEDIEKTKTKIQSLKKDIEAEEIRLGIQEKPIENSLEWFDAEIEKREKDLKKGLIPKEAIEKTKQEIIDFTKKKYKLEIELGFKEAPKTDFEKNNFAEKYVNDWANLEKYVSDYNAKWDEYQASLKQYETDMAAYNAAWDKYNSNMAKYNQQQKQFAKYNELLKKSTELENKHDNEQISDDKYLKERTKLDEQLDNLSNQLWPVDNSASEELTDFNAKIAELGEKMQQGLITAEEYNAEFEKLCQQGEQLDNVMVRGFAKPIKPIIELPKKPFAPGQKIDLKEIFGESLDRIPAHIQQLMNMVQQRMNENISDGERAIGGQILVELQKYFNEVSEGEFEIRPRIAPQFYEKGTEDWVRKQQEYASQAAQQWQSDYSIGLISFDKFKEQMELINDYLESLHLKPIILEIKSPLFETLDHAADTLNQFGESIKQMGDATDNLALKAAGTIAQAIANIWLGYSQASLQAASMGPWAWVGFSVGALAQVIGVVSAMKSSGAFADGGIIGGSSYHGDRLIANVNAGEMILNGRQQKNLFNAIDKNRLGSDNAQSISFKIKGSDLYGTLKNYSKIKGKSGVNTGIQ